MSTLIQDYGSHICRYHCIIRPEGAYDVQNQFFEELEYLTFDILRSPLNQAAIKYYAEMGNQPIIHRQQDGTILDLKDRQPRYSSQGFNYNVLPISLQINRLYGVPLSKLSFWESQIADQNEQLRSPDVELPKYEDTELLVFNEWLGVINGDRRDLIYNMLSLTAEIGLLHAYTVDNKSLFNPDVKRNKMSCKFYLRPCLDFDCGICSELIKLPRKGVFHVGEKLTDLQKPLDRYELKTLNSILVDILEPVNLMLQSAAIAADSTTVQNADVKTLERMKQNYQEMNQVLEDSETKEEDTHQ